MSESGPKTPFLSLALVSAAALLFEVSLVRILAIVGWQAVAAQAVSIAMVGIGAAGTLLFLWPQDGLAEERFLRRYSVCAALFCLSLPACTHAAAAIPYEPFFTHRLADSLLALAGRVAVLAVPFFLAAFLLGLTLVHRPAEAGRTYAANLAGAAVGALSFPAAAGWLFPSPLVLLCTALAAVAVLLRPGLRRRQRLTLALAAALGLAWLGRLGVPRLELSPYKDLSSAALLPGAEVEHPGHDAQGLLSTVRSAALHSAPGLSLQADVAPPPQIGLFLNGEGHGTVDRVLPGEPPPAYLRFRPESLAFELGPAERTLVAGAGGGSLVWLALSRGARQIVALEPVAAVERLVDGPLAQFSGAPYRRPGVMHVADEARPYLAASREVFDVILLPLPQGFQDAAMGLASLEENALYTIEGLRQAAARLAPGGRLVLGAWLHEPPQDALRLLALAFAVARQEGLEVLAHRSWGQLAVLLLRGPAGPELLAGYTQRLDELGFDPVWLPGLKAEQANRINVVDRPVLFEAAARLAADPEASLHDLAGSADLSPPTEDRPYFGRFASPAALLHAVLGRPDGPLEWGTVLGALSLVVTALLSAVLILLPLARRGLRTRLRAAPGAGRTTLYFASIGLGYIAVELLFLSRLVLVLHQPALATSVVLAGFLGGSGLGSLACGGLLRRGWRPAGIALAAGLSVALLCPLLLELFRLALVPLASLPDAVRTAACLALLAPLSFAMGFLFPAGVRQVELWNGAALPWAYALNGYTSAVSPLLVALAAPFTGHRLLAAAAAVLYLVAAVSLGRNAKPPEP